MRAKLDGQKGAHAPFVFVQRDKYYFAKPVQSNRHPVGIQFNITREDFQRFAAG